MSWLPKLSKIDKPIAEDHWSYKAKDGTDRVSRVTVGEPVPIPDDPNGDWYCPVFIEHKTEGINCVVGVGPVDALMNAMRLVQSFFDEIGGPTPRSGAPSSP